MQSLFGGLELLWCAHSKLQSVTTAGCFGAVALAVYFLFFPRSSLSRTNSVAGAGTYLATRLCAGNGVFVQMRFPPACSPPQFQFLFLSTSSCSPPPFTFHVGAVPLN